MTMDYLTLLHFKKWSLILPSFSIGWTECFPSNGQDGTEITVLALKVRP